MPLYIHTIKSAKGASKKRKRVGRGNASGHGTYSTRGLKGQKSRSGVSNLKRLGMKQMMLRTPKKRGFKSDKPKDQIILLSQINENFKDGGAVTPKILKVKKLIENGGAGVKILGNAQLKLKNLQISDIKISASAKEQVEKLGGKIEAGSKK